MDAREDPYDVVRRGAELPDAVVRYAEHPDGLVDVCLPPSLGRPDRPSPLVIVVHGGFWRQEWDRRHARPLADDLVRRGYVVALPEYRRTGGGGGWPQTGADVATAIEATPRLVDDVAPGRVDPAAGVVLVGHSAGGHLALWAGLRTDPGRVHRVVALAPVTDLAEAARLDLDAGAAQDLLGGAPDDVPEQYADADPLAALSATSPEVVVLHGTADLQVPVAMSRAAAGRYPTLRYVELEGVDHFALIDPLSAAYGDAVLPAVGA